MSVNNADNPFLANDPFLYYLKTFYTTPQFFKALLLPSKNKQGALVFGLRKLFNHSISIELFSGSIERKIDCKRKLTPFFWDKVLIFYESVLIQYYCSNLPDSIFHIFLKSSPYFQDFTVAQKRRLQYYSQVNSCQKIVIFNYIIHYLPNILFLTHPGHI